jgi:hypothetical protein
VKSIVIAAAAVLIGSGVSGCVPVIGTLTLNDLMTGTSLMTTALTGKSLSDHALSMATHEDCSLMDAALEKDRHICETPGSKVTEGEFKGLLAMRETSKPPPQLEPQPQPAANVQTAANTSKPQVAADPGMVHVTGGVPLGLITAHVPVRELPAVVSASADAQPGDFAGEQ